MRTRIAAALLLLAAPATRAGAYFGSSAIGVTGSQFLTTDIGARGIAMGGAYTAVSDDATSLYWNPATLTRVKRLSVSLMYAQDVADINYQAIEAAKRINETSVVAAGLRYQDLGSIPETDLSGNSLGTLHPRDYVAEAGWAQKVSGLSDPDMDVSVGAAARLIHSDYGLSANGYGLDLGVLSHLYNGPFPYDLAFALQNMGAGQRFDQVKDPLPFRIKLGGAFYPVSGLTLAADADFPSGGQPYGALGLEYVMDLGGGLKAALRAGFNSTTMQDLGFGSTLSAGVGLTLGQFRFDYAFTNEGVLGDVNRVSLGFDLPALVSQRRAENYEENYDGF